MSAMLQSEVVDLANASDSELVQRIVTSHSTDAEAELCRRLAPRLRLYGLRHLRDEQAAADLVQHVLIIMLESIREGRVREPDKLASFALGACRMTVLDLRRGNRRRQTRSHGQQGSARAARGRDFRGRVAQGRGRRIRGQCGRGHPRHSSADGRAGGQYAPIHLRHYQRHLELHSVSDDP